MAGERDEPAEARAAPGPRESIPLARLFALVDGVVAIAMTLLVLDIRLPPGLSGAELRRAVDELRPDLFAFLLSVIVIGLFWRGHHVVLKDAGRVDGPLLMLNFAFLALVALIPFPTSVLNDYANQPVGPILYASNIGLTALVELLMWLYVIRRDRPSAERIAPARRRAVVLNTLATAVVFVGSIPIALVSPDAALFSWLLLIPIRIAVRTIYRTG